MKTIALLAFCSGKAQAQWGGVLAGNGSAAAPSTQYFGFTNTGSLTSTDNWPGYTLRNNDTNNPFTCPGSGTLRVVSLELWCKSNGGTPGVIRLAIYDTSLNLVGQGVATVTVSSTTAGWVGHITTADLKPAGGSAGQAVNVTGGTNYVLAWSASTGDVIIPYVSQASNIFYQLTNNTGGFPNPLGGSDTGFGEKFCARIGVQ